MTGTASSRGMSVFDVDIHRNQEWLRRRKLRLEQVRKQSNEIAKVLRRKVNNEEKARLDEYDRMSEAKFRDWQAEKLDELEKKFRSALEDFGTGYKLAEEEPDPEEIIEERFKVNMAKAQKRGEIAQQEELRRRKIAEEQKTSLIERKKLIRKKEDLRSALVHSVPIKKQIIDTQKILEESLHPEKVTVITPKKKKITNHKNKNLGEFQKKVCSKVKRKKVVPQKSCMCKQKDKPSEFCPFKGPDTIWINLNEIQNSSTGDSGVHPSSSKSSISNEKNQKGKPEGVVEFYDFSSRYYRKSFKEFPHLVEKIESESEMPNANDLAKIEDEEEKVEAQKRVEADTVSQERGMEALRREKINQDYNNLIAKLEELNRKEKILKAQQRNLPNFLHMNDERLSERLQAKQRLMNSKFENIYYEAVSQNPRADHPLPKSFYRKGGGDFAETNEGMSAPLSSRLKTNSPVTSDGESCRGTPLDGTIRKSKKTKKKRQLLLDIDKALKEGRELRKSVSKSRDLRLDGGEENDEKSSSDLEELRFPGADVLPAPEEGSTTKCQESQTEELKGVDVGVGEMDVQDLRKTGDDSLPASTSTSYKSPPSVIRSYRLRQFLEYLEIAAGGDDSLKQNGSKFNRKVDKLLHGLMQEENSNAKKEREESKETRESPTLEYYIEKLLNMSRECIADLSVSSENISTPNITDLDVRDLNVPEPAISFKVAPKREDRIKKRRLERANELEETIRHWKQILEMNSEEHSQMEDVPDCPQPELARGEETNEKELEEPLCIIYSPKIMSSRYEEITKKCSERITELSNMLDKVRKDKEKLLGSTSGGSSLSLNKDGRHFEKEVNDAEEEEESVERCVVSLEDPKTSLVEGFLNRYNVSKPRKETVSTIALADSQSLEDLEDSLESWPDVMDELLKRKILTSPFKWSDGDFSSELTPVSETQTKPSSIETVIGNFRKEISKIKPFKLSGEPSRPSESHSPDERTDEVLDGTKEKFPCRWLSIESAQIFKEESSVESINQALTTLGLNWAKSFLRKNEESRAISSSSNSEGKCSADEADDYS